MFHIDLDTIESDQTNHLDELGRHIRRRARHANRLVLSQLLQHSIRLHHSAPIEIQIPSKFKTGKCQVPPSGFGEWQYTPLNCNLDLNDPAWLVAG